MSNVTYHAVDRVAHGRCITTETPDRSYVSVVREGKIVSHAVSHLSFATDGHLPLFMHDVSIPSEHIEAIRRVIAEDSRDMYAGVTLPSWLVQNLTTLVNVQKKIIAIKTLRCYLKAHLPNLPNDLKTTKEFVDKLGN